MPGVLQLATSANIRGAEVFTRKVAPLFELLGRDFLAQGFPCMNRTLRTIRYFAFLVGKFVSFARSLLESFQAFVLDGLHVLVRNYGPILLLPFKAVTSVFPCLNLFFRL